MGLIWSINLYLVSFYLKLKVSSFISLEIRFAPDLLAAPMPLSPEESMRFVCGSVGFSYAPHTHPRRACLFLYSLPPVLVLGDLDADVHGRDWTCTWSNWTAHPQNLTQTPASAPYPQPVVGHNRFTKSYYREVLTIVWNVLNTWSPKYRQHDTLLKASLWRYRDSVNERKCSKISCSINTVWYNDPGRHPLPPTFLAVVTLLLSQRMVRRFTRRQQTHHRPVFSSSQHLQNLPFPFLQMMPQILRTLYP